MSEPDKRPDPDALLRRIVDEEARARRGKLKIFFGFAPGVGKTYRMLQVARDLIDRQLDVVFSVLVEIARAIVEKLKVMSVALFTGDNAVPMRGMEKPELITQLFSLTDWGALDYLVVDLPPSTGDELLTAFDLFAGMSTLVLVTTPSTNAISVVSRLKRLAVSEGVPVAGAVVNMAFSTVGKKRVFPFGRMGADAVRTRLGTRLLVEIPLYPRVNAKSLREVLRGRNELSVAFDELARLITAI
jgi:Mrp family chromosome partitioning ATPase